MAGKSLSTQFPSGFMETQRAELVNIIQAAFQLQKQSSALVEWRIDALPVVKK